MIDFLKDLLDFLQDVLDVLTHFKSFHKEFLFDRRPQGFDRFLKAFHIFKALRAAPALRPSAQRAPQRPPDPLVS